MSTTEFRDAVIAGLRERGWPQPQIDGKVPVWAGDLPLLGACPVIYVLFGRNKIHARWKVPDGSKGVSHVPFGDVEKAIEKAIEAIDRLRWVFWDWRSGTK